MLIIKKCNIKNIYYDGNIEDWCHFETSDFICSQDSNEVIKRHLFLKNDNNPMAFTNNFYFLNDLNEFEEITTIELPSGYSVNSNQFVGAGFLETLIIPNDVGKIDVYAFSNCNIKNI